MCVWEGVFVSLIQIGVASPFITVWSLFFVGRRGGVALGEGNKLLKIAVFCPVDGEETKVKTSVLLFANN